ncbi:MAG: hypothetical protein K940chlam3_01223 [Chlamydiae bacterium]|nr:hypothetical protein [Chlamydiota bacterium]
MSNQTKNAMIGVFVLVGLGILTYILLFLHPKIGDEGQILRVRFTDIDKVSIGTRVLFAGHPVGEVTNIQEIDDARQKDKLYKGEVYIYELTLKIDSGVIVYTTDEISAMTSGLLGERQVLISPKPPKPGQILVRVTDQILYATPPVSIEETLKLVSDFTEKLDTGFATLEKDEFWENMGAIAENVAEISDSLNKPEELESFITNASEFSDNLNNDLYLRVTSILSKGETLMDDINHYGILFHTNKSWQRLRARRVNLMGTLSTPSEFNNFFTDEINQISTSLSRVNMVLNDGEGCADYWKTLCGKEFVKVFADLLRRIDGLEQNIKLVNQQIVENREECCNCQ